MMRVIGVRLRPGVGYLLWRRPMCELLNRRVRYRAPDLVRRLAGEQSLDACFEVLEWYLGRRLEGAWLDSRVAAAVSAIGESAGDARLRVEEVARRAGISRRQLERLLRVWVGVSPKRLARVARFQATLRNLTGGPVRRWTQVAADFYADQSHMIHEFAEFAGASPRRFGALRGANASPARCR